MDSNILTKFKWLFNTPVTRIVIGFLVCTTLMVMFEGVLRDIGERSSETPAWQFLARAAFNISVYWLLFSLWEKRSITELSLKKFHIDGVASLFFGFALISIVVLILFVTNNYLFISFAAFNLIIYLLAKLLAASILEEVLLRGIVYRITEENLNTIWAIVISSVIFSLLHLGNSGFDVVSLISLMLLGALLGIIYSLTKNLWSVIFVHLGWNFAQAFFGFKISGKDLAGTSISEFNSTVWLTGGKFGLENSYITIGILIIVFVLLYRKHILRIQNEKTT